MDFLLAAVAFLIAIIIGLALGVLAMGGTTDFSINLKYFGFNFRIGNSAKMSKRKPSPDEEPEKETISDEESGDETNPDDTPKKEDNPKDKNNPGNKRKAIRAAIGATVGAGAAARDQTVDFSVNANYAHCDAGNKRKAIGIVIGVTVGAGMALVGLPMCIKALGFTGAGIATGSITAKMMSAAAIVKGGGVAMLQSIRAAGFSLGAKVGLAAALGSVGAGSAFLFKWKKPPSDKIKKGKNPSDKTKKK